VIPSIVVTGASGFIGRNLLEDLKDEYRIFAIARRSQQECKALIHPNIAWIRADIADYESISAAFREIASAGGADYLFHLAAFYDFSGRDHAEYRRTNVEGTRHILKLAQNLQLRLLVFVSSVAACSFPAKGDDIDETVAPDAQFPYAWSKSVGEKMIQDLRDRLPACIIRLGAVYSDWCEYPPLYGFLNTWLGKSLKANILAGKGESAVPYIHVRDVVAFFRQVIKYQNRLKPAEILIASTNGSTTHKELFHIATRYFFGKPKRPIFLPRFIAGIGLQLMNMWGYLTKNPPIERPWMRHYIDLKLNINSSYSCSLIDWSPDSRHLIERRIPYLVERLKSEPYAWHVRNLAALKRDVARPEFRIYIALSNLEDEVIQSLLERILMSGGDSRYPIFQRLDEAELTWFVKLIYRLLLTSIHTSNRLLILNYFEISGTSRFQVGHTAQDLTHLLTQLNDIIMMRMKKLDELKSYGQELYDLVSMPIEFGKDEIEHQYQLFLHSGAEERLLEKPLASVAAKSAREQLEETIWSCLVHRK
jgi:nucleoside-diphosphate-sugar epimerase